MKTEEAAMRALEWPSSPCTEKIWVLDLGMLLVPVVAVIRGQSDQGCIRLYYSNCSGRE